MKRMARARRDRCGPALCAKDGGGVKGSRSTAASLRRTSSAMGPKTGSKQGAAPGRCVRPRRPRLDGLWRFAKTNKEGKKKKKKKGTYKTRPTRVQSARAHSIVLIAPKGIRKRLDKYVNMVRAFAIIFSQLGRRRGQKKDRPPATGIQAVRSAK